jgi:hypothetical protein
LSLGTEANGREKPNGTGLIDARVGGAKQAIASLCAMRASWRKIARYSQGHPDQCKPRIRM